MSNNGLQALIGKQIAGIITVQGRKTGPHDQVLLVFDDDTYFEIFGSELEWLEGVHPGGHDAVMKTVRTEGGYITEIGAYESSFE